MSLTCESSRWWSQVGGESGMALLDQHVGPDADWARAVATGEADWQRASRLTEILTGPTYRMLEIGCGAGRMTCVLAPKYSEVTALDVSESYLESARRNCPHSNVSFRPIQSDDLSAADGREYDVAFSYEVFHYLAPRLLQKYFVEVHRLLRAGGQFVFEINTAPVGWRTRLSLAVRRVLHWCGVETWRGWPTSPHFIRKDYSPQTVTAMLEQAGFRVDKVTQPGRRETWFVATK